MGAVTEICNQTDNIASHLDALVTEESRFQANVDLATAPEQLQ